MVEYDFGDSVVLVTGGARGLGRSHARAYAAAGADVALFDVRADRLEETVDELEALGVRALGVECDVTDERAVIDAVDDVLAAFGRVDVLVNNAGIDRMGRLTELDEETWDAVQSVNLKGTWLCAKHVGAHMLDRDGGGSIVNTASMFGHTTIPGLGAYSASKFGVVSLTRTLAQELAGAGVTVNAVSPIGVRTEAVDDRPDEDENFLAAGVDYQGTYNLLDPGERIDPADVTNAVLWLTSDQARYVTGTALPIDAGALA
jgi:NAD(P)-dependent dehydrogenase (short-subunit alcohol dehydrogenase family)